MIDPARFIPARELSHELAKNIEPLLRTEFPNIPLSLAFLGAGSDVLGYDTKRSMDHDWGPRLTIVVPEGAVGEVSAKLSDDLDSMLPSKIRGFPTRFTRHEDGTLSASPSGSMHRLEVLSVSGILESTVGARAIDALTVADWLSTPMQSLMEFTSGEVFVDDSGELTRARKDLAFFPSDVWRYQLSALWMRVSQNNPFIGRTGEVEDAAGSVIVAASIARDLMRIALLQSRCYAPYSKWLGTAFRRTEAGAEMYPRFGHALTADSWSDREQGINEAGLKLVKQLNSLELIDRIPDETERFHSRPFTVLPAERIAHALQLSLTGTECEHQPLFVGGIDMVTDSTDALKNAGFRKAIRSVFARS